LSELETQLEQIKAALADLRAQTGAGVVTRKQLDSLFRRVHNLKAAASADGLSDLSHAAHELENILHSLRTGKSTLNGEALQQLTKTSAALGDNLLPRAIWSSLKTEEKHVFRQCVKEGANLFLVQTSFNAADFDQQFQKLKEELGRIGETISVSPRADGEKINFRILYATTAAAHEILTGISDVKIEPLLIQTTNSLDAVLNRAVRAGQAAALALGKQIDFEVTGGDRSLDKGLCDALAAPLLHLVRNAVDHGIESRGRIVIDAKSSEGATIITVADDGRGIEPSVIPFIFCPGFSTKTEVSETSGRGVGLDVVKTTIEELGGSINVSTESGKGSSFTIRVPNPR